MGPLGAGRLGAMLFVTGTLSGASFREARAVCGPQGFKILFFPANRRAVVKYEAQGARRV